MLTVKCNILVTSYTADMNLVEACPRFATCQIGWRLPRRSGGTHINPELKTRSRRLAPTAFHGKRGWNAARRRWDAWSAAAGPHRGRLHGSRSPVTQAIGRPSFVLWARRRRAPLCAKPRGSRPQAPAQAASVHAQCGIPSRLRARTPRHERRPARAH